MQNKLKKPETRPMTNTDRLKIIMNTLAEVQGEQRGQFSNVYERLVIDSTKMKKKLEITRWNIVLYVSVGFLLGAIAGVCGVLLLALINNF